MTAFLLHRPRRVMPSGVASGDHATAVREAGHGNVLDRAR
jgi:hypothetical protein